MARVRVASITVLASLGIVLGAAPGAFAQSTDTTSAAPSPISPTPRQAQKAQRKAADAQTAATESTAQPGGGSPTRASEKADLKNLEAHGYRPVANESNYPNDIQKAEKATYGSGVTGATGTTGSTKAKAPVRSDN